MGRPDYSPRAMTKTLALAALTAALLSATAASAQMYPGEGISVNSQAPSFYAAGPRGPYPGVIHLTPPGAHRATTGHHHHHHAAKKAGPSSAEIGDALMAAQPAPQEPAKPKHTKSAEAAPPAPDEAADGGIPLSLAPGEPNPPQSQTSRKAKPEKQASIAPAPAAAANIVPAQQTPGAKSNLAKRSEILFARNATDPGNATINKLHGIANDLNTLLGAGAARVQLDAYGGPPGDKSSDSRRLSLKRALVIRQILIEDGVPSERIDVRALGGIDDHGAPDRVDVYVSAS
ncbi:MAG: hypothetical protein ACTHLR_11200 [Rhizomicrobium sp.]